MTGKEALRRLCGEGWTVIRQTGKHTLLQKDGRKATVSLGRVSPRAERSLLRLLRGQGTRSDQHSGVEATMHREKRLPGPSCDLDDAGDPIPRDRMNAPPPPDLYPVRGPELDMDAAGDPQPRGRR